MSDASDIALADDRPRPPAATKVRVPATRNGKEIRGPLKVACDLMVYGDDEQKVYDWKAACDKAGYSRVSMRKALERPHVLRYLREQKQVFRQHASAGNISRALEIRDQDENKTAAIQAIRYLDGVSEQDAAREGAQRVTPGVVVQVTVNAGGQREVDETLIEVNAAPHADREAADDGR